MRGGFALSRVVVSGFSSAGDWLGLEARECEGACERAAAVSVTEKPRDCPLEGKVVI